MDEQVEQARKFIEALPAYKDAPLSEAIEFMECLIGELETNLEGLRAST